MKTKTGGKKSAVARTSFPTVSSCMYLRSFPIDCYR